MTGCTHPCLTSACPVNSADIVLLPATAKLKKSVHRQPHTCRPRLCCDTSDIVGHQRWFLASRVVSYPSPAPLTHRDVLRHGPPSMAPRCPIPPGSHMIASRACAATARACYRRVACALPRFLLLADHTTVRGYCFKTWCANARVKRASWRVCSFVR